MLNDMLCRRRSLHAEHHQQQGRGSPAGLQSGPGNRLALCKMGVSDMSDSCVCGVCVCVCVCVCTWITLCLYIDYDKPYEARLEKTLKKFTAKPVTQLCVVPEHGLFLALSCKFIYMYKILMLDSSNV